MGTLQSENKCILHYEMATACAGLSGMLSVNVFGHLNRQLVALFGRLWNFKEVSLKDGEDKTHFRFQSRILLHSLLPVCPWNIISLSPTPTAMRERLPQTINQNKGEKCNKKARTEKYFCTLSETKKDKIQ